VKKRKEETSQEGKWVREVGESEGVLERKGDLAHRRDATRANWARKPAPFGKRKRGRGALNRNAKAEKSRGKYATYFQVANCW